MTSKPVSPHFRTGVLLIGAAALAVTGFSGFARASSITEPPVVIFGKVLQHGEGASYQLFHGELAVTVVSESDPANRIVLRTALREVGESGEHSFRFELPQKHLPSAQDLEEHLEVGRSPQSFRFESIAVDGQPATPLDPARATFSTAFSLRAIEHRLDLRVALVEVDADRDAMPDWWEDRFALNRHSAADAATDLDGDGLTNLQEFRGGTDPTIANTSPLVRTRRLVFPAGGTSGIVLSIIDVDTPPSRISVRVAESPSGVAFLLRGNELPIGAAFTQADLLAGAVTAKVGRDFAGGVVRFEVADLDGGESQSVPVTADVFSPWNGSGHQPLLWLDAERLADGPVVEWADGSGGGRDAFQPDAPFQPVAGSGAVDFGGDGYLFIDMKDLALDAFSAFACFDLANHHSDSQTLLRTSEAAIEIAGAAAGGRSRRLVATQPGRATVGPALEAGRTTQFSMIGGAAGSFLRAEGAGFYPSAEIEGNSLPTSFATLGGSQQIADTMAVALLDGKLREIVVFPGTIAPPARSRFEDYQRSRWGDAVVWDFRDETAPMTVTAGGGAPNLISGGWVDDRLTGGDGPDILRGGPGDDLLAGGRGGDNFAFGSDSGGADRVADFSRAEGDVIDLVDIFADLVGVDPAACVRLRNRIVTSGGTKPTVDTVLELDHDGVGGDVDQTITLTGVALGAGDLPALLAEGSLVLGGPRYLTTVELTADATTIPAAPVPCEIEVRRSGATNAAAIQIPLVFGGSLAVDADYRVDGAAGEGPLRSVAFAAGETARRISVTPLTSAAGGTIAIHVAADPGFVPGGSGSLTLTLTEAARVRLATRSHAFRENAVPGVVAVSRDGALDSPLTLLVALDGSAVESVDYAALPESITIPAGSETAELRLVPNEAGSGAGGFPVARVALVPQGGGAIMADPGWTDVVIFDAPGDAGGESFAAWKQREFPGSNDPALAQRDPDGDGIINLWEYIHGTDPRVRDARGDVAPRIRLVDGRLEVELLSRADLTDVQVVLEGAVDLDAWSAGMADDLPVIFEAVEGGSSGPYRRIHRAKAPLDASGTPPHRAFRFRAIEVPVAAP